jgi:uncharacterized protein (DUF2345 family)
MANENQDNSTSSNDEAASSVPSGGAGETPAWSDPDIVMSAPAGITMLTPQSASFNAGSTTSVAAGQDINLLAQANLSYSIKGGISLFTYGKASNPKKPNQEVGIKLHAASGKVSSQSQRDKTLITADKAITVASTTDAVQIQAPKHILLTAQGAYIKMSGGNIEIHAPGMVDFKASMKSWTGAKSDQVDMLELPRGEGLGQYAMSVGVYALEGTPLEGAEIAVYQSDNKNPIWNEKLGFTATSKTNIRPNTDTYVALVGYDAWSSSFEDVDVISQDTSLYNSDSSESEENDREEEQLTRESKNV